MTSTPAIATHPKLEVWHRQSVEEVLTQIASTSDRLSSRKAATRLAANGPNALKEGTRIGPLQIFLDQFESLIVWILIVIGLDSGLGKTMGDMSSMMGEMKQMTDSAKMTPEEMQNMSKTMGEMSGMMKQMSDRMGRGMKKAP